MSLKCLKHHKKLSISFVVGGVAILGSYLAIKYITNQQRAWRERMDNNTKVLNRKNQHFYSNQQTADNRIYTISEGLKIKLDEIADISYLLQQLRERSEDKLILWENLKILSFSRIIATTYLLSVLAVIIRVQLNIVGGLLFVEALNRTHDSDFSSNVGEIQHEYLQCSDYIVENGVAQCLEVVTKHVKAVLSKYSLKQVLDFTQLDQIFTEINTLILEPPNNELLEGKSKFGAHLLELFFPSHISSDDQQLSRLFDLTRDILEQDFLEVLSICAETGFLHISRCIAAQVYSNSSSSNENNSSLESIQLAKLIPIITKCCEALYSGGVNSFLFEILTKKEVSQLSHNVYEAFSFNAHQ